MHSFIWSPFRKRSITASPWYISSNRLDTSLTDEHRGSIGRAPWQSKPKKCLPFLCHSSISYHRCSILHSFPTCFSFSLFMPPMMLSRYIASHCHFIQNKYARHFSRTIEGHASASAPVISFSSYSRTQACFLNACFSQTAGTFLYLPFNPSMFHKDGSLLFWLVTTAPPPLPPHVTYDRNWQTWQPYHDDQGNT